MKNLFTTCSLIFLPTALLLISGCGSSIQTPKAYKQWNHKDGTFCIDYPEGWNADGGARKDNLTGWAKFTKGGVTVRVDVSAIDSIFGDVVRQYNRGGDPTQGKIRDEERAEAVIHAAYVDEYKELFSGYNERNGTSFTTPLGPARRTEFVYNSGMAGKDHGYRATVMAQNKSVTFMGYGPNSQWKVLEPIFDKMIRSMKVGTPQM